MSPIFEQMTYVNRGYCPACHSEVDDVGARSERLVVSEYRFGGYTVPLREQNQVTQCSRCGLWVKNVVPEASSLSALFSKSIGKAWSSHYDYAQELKLARALCPSPNARVMDVGASNGELLRAFSGFYAWRSALDVVVNPECSVQVTGEYVIGLLDDAEITWSGDPYDLVMVFDVLEHLYDVKRGMLNLNKILRSGGYAVIETGDAESRLPNRFGLGSWWYMNLIEHHQAFTASSLEYVAADAGFRLVSIRRKRHKNRRMLSVKGLIRRGIQSVCYQLAPNIYDQFSPVRRQPAPPFGKDHLLVVLQKEREAV